MSMATIHIKIGESELESLRLLAKKDRRRPAELVRFAVEEYLENRAADVRALRPRKNVVTVVPPIQPTALLPSVGETVEQSVRLNLATDEASKSEEPKA